MGVFLAAQARGVGLRAVLFLSSAGTLRRAALPASHRAWRGAATAHPHATHPKQACGWHNGVQTMPYGRVGFRPEVTARGLGIRRCTF